MRRRFNKSSAVKRAFVAGLKKGKRIGFRKGRKSRGWRR